MCKSPVEVFWFLKLKNLLNYLFSVWNWVHFSESVVHKTTHQNHFTLCIVKKEYERSIYDCCLVGENRVMSCSIELGRGYILTISFNISTRAWDTSNMTENRVNQSVVSTSPNCITSDPIQNFSINWLNSMKLGLNVIPLETTILLYLLILFHQ